MKRSFAATRSSSVRKNGPVCLEDGEFSFSNSGVGEEIGGNSCAENSAWRSVLLGVVHVGTALEVSYAGCALETQSGIRQVNILICTNRDECAGKALSIVRHQP